MRLAAVIRLCVFWGVVLQVATSVSRSGRKKGAAGRRTRQVFRAEPVEGVWSQWGAWSECTQTCGVGVSQRTRDCNAPPLPPPQTPPLSHAPPNWGGYFPPAASSRPYSRPPSYYHPPPVSTNRSPGGLPLYRTDPIGGGGGEGGGPLLPGGAGAAANHPSRRFYQPDFSSPAANQDPAVSVYRSPYHRSGTAHGYNQPTRITRRPTNPGSQQRPGGGAGGGTRREGLNSRRSPIRPGQFGYGRVPFSLPLHRQTRHTANGTVDEDTPTGAPAAANQDGSDAAAPMGAPVGGGAEGEGGGNIRETGGGGGGGGGGGEDEGRNKDRGQQQEEAKTEESAGPSPSSGRAREREQRAPPPFPPPSSRGAASAAAARRTFDWHSVAAPPPPPRGHAPPHSSSSSSHPYSSDSSSSSSSHPYSSDSSSSSPDGVPPPPFSSPLHRTEPHPPPPHHQAGETATRQHTCSGRPTEFRRCFSQVCAGAADSRSAQCSAFNNQEFMGRYYNWEPFTEVGPDKQCELTCRPVGYRFYVVQAETVRDGTPCVNTSTNDVCVAGQCLTEGCDGVLGSGSAVDRCGVCGGGQRSCRKVTGSFLNSSLPLGYNKMLTLPVGATHLNITERHASSNYLALRSGTGVSVVNGRWAVDAPGSYQGGGTTFTYTRPRASSSGQQEGGESLTAPGPTTTILHLYIIFHKQNPGVDYEFYVPAEKDAESERPKEREVATLERERPREREVATLERERPREREVTMERERHRERDGGRSPLRSANPLTVSVEEDAPPLPPPVSLPSFPGSSSSDRWTADRSRPRGSAPNRNARIPPRTDVPLDTQPPFVWKRRSITQCSVSCGKGSQYRVVVCVDRHSESNEVVPDRKCDSAAKPLPEEEPCNTQACPAFWEASAWSECSVSCGQGLQQRQLQCRQTFGNRSTMVHPTHCSTLRPPASTQPCQTSLCSHWEVGSDWSACSVDCGIGKRTRSVRCVSDDGNDVSDTECSTRLRPEGSEECNMGQCVTNWYFTDWSKTCSAECGPGIDRREVVCLTGGAGADRGEGAGGGDCVGDKPAEMKACNGGPCVSVTSWYSSPWSQCNVRCGNGTQRRDVICVRKAGSDLGVVPPGECRQQGDKPPAVKECHMVNCPPAWFTTAWTACSSSCGEGMQVREVRCLTQDKQHSPDCEGDFKPPHRQICNILPCSPQLPDENCRDRRHNCVMVVQARLCVYSYYKTSCCASCTQNAQRTKRH